MQPVVAGNESRRGCHSRWMLTVARVFQQPDERRRPERIRSLSGRFVTGLQSMRRQRDWIRPRPAVSDKRRGAAGPGARSRHQAAYLKLPNTCRRRRLVRTSSRNVGVSCIGKHACTCARASRVCSLGEQAGGFEATAGWFPGRRRRGKSGWRPVARRIGFNIICIMRNEV